MRHFYWARLRLCRWWSGTKWLIFCSMLMILFMKCCSLSYKRKCVCLDIYYFPNISLTLTMQSIGHVFSACGLWYQTCILTTHRPQINTQLCRIIGGHKPPTSAAHTIMTPSFTTMYIKFQRARRSLGIELYSSIHAHKNDQNDFVFIVHSGAVCGCRWPVIAITLFCVCTWFVARRPRLGLKIALCAGLVRW